MQRSIEPPSRPAVEQVEAIAADAEARLIVHADPSLRRHDYAHEFDGQAGDAQVDQRNGTERLDDFDAPRTVAVAVRR